MQRIAHPTASTKAPNARIRANVSAASKPTFVARAASVSRGIEKEDYIDTVRGID